MAIISWLFGSQATKDTPSTPSIAPTQSQQLPSAIATPSSSPASSAGPFTTAAEVGRAGAPSPFDAPPSRSPLFSTRSLKQLGLFVAGAGFLTASILVSRRAAVRHHLGSQLKYYHPNHRSTTKGDNLERRDPLVAVEALNLATLNVMGFAIMATGGLAWAFDISSLEELRVKARRSLYGPGGVADDDAEREVAEWVAKTLGNHVERGNEDDGSKKESKSR